MRLLPPLLLAFLLIGCGPPNESYTVVGNADSLENLRDMHAVSSKSNTDLTAMRADGIQDIAMSLGAQAGLAWRSKQINDILTGNAPSLDRAFDFNLMLLNHNVVPPVLVEGENTLNLDNDQTIRISDRTYKIASQARFATTPPNWREYLWMSYKKPEQPQAAFLPKNSDEQAIWKKYSAIGWNEGVTQANTIYAENLARLKRDYTGMARYRYLLRQGMVSAPFVARTELGVTGDESNLRVNDQILRITALPRLQTNPKRWKPVVVKDGA